MGFLQKKWVKYLFQALGILLFVVILTRVDLGRILDSYRNLGARHVITAFGIILLFNLAKSIRWKVIVALQGVNVTVPRALTVYASSLYLGLVTPGRIGDFAKSFYLVNSGMKPGRAVFSSILDRMFDLIFLAVIGYVSLLLFPGIFRNQFALSTLVLGLAILLTLAVFWRRDLLERLIKGFVSGIAPSRLRSNLDGLVTDVLGDFGLITGGRAVEIAVLTLAAWSLHYLFFIFMAGALGIEASAGMLLVSISAAIFTSLLPVSLSGLGTRDIVLILIFSRIGLSREAAVTFSFMFVLVYIIMGLTGLICLLTAPFHTGRIAGEYAGEE